MKKPIVVSDTNIFIDLINCKLLDLFFSLELEICTTDLVKEEITNEDQLKEIEKYSSKLKIKKFNGRDMEELVQFRATVTPKLSIPDCSVLKYAQDNHYMLISGDKKLRNVAIEKGVKVGGILYIIQLMLDDELLTRELAVTCLEVLKASNIRLPMKEIDAMINELSK